MFSVFGCDVLFEFVGSQRIATTERKPLVVGLCFPKLFSEIGSILPSSGAQNLEIWYKDFKVNYKC